MSLSRDFLESNIGQFKEIVESHPIEKRNAWLADQYLFDLPAKWIYSNVAVSDEGRVLGFILASKKENNTVHLHKWYVHEKHQHQGIGIQLFMDVYRKAKHEGIGAFTLKVYQENKNALNFYESLGFTKINWITDTATNLTLIEMKLPVELVRMRMKRWQ